MLGEWQSLFLLLPERYPTLITDAQVLQLIESVRGEVGKFGQWAVSFSLSSLPMLVGLSVVVPYIGAVVVTVPVALIGLFQWGFSDQFVYLMVVYGIIQALDGNVLVPLLFSEAVNLHPVAIICAVLLFGGLWGFWGVFFAIPLATLFKAVIDAWPRREQVVAE